MPKSYTLNREPIECTCARAQHKHGTIPMYDSCKCRCDECCKAKAAYTARRMNFVPDVCGKSAQARLALIQEAGHTLPTIVKISGICEESLSKLRRSKKPKIRPETRDAIMSISFSELLLWKPASKLSYVDTAVPLAQMQELSACGWSITDIAEYRQINEGGIRGLLAGKRIVHKTSEAINASYLHFRHKTPPEETRLQQTRVKRAKKLARENGWDPLMTELAA